MGLARGKYVREGEVGVYHCFCRCVRRAFLCGIDPVTRRDFSHRKAWLVERMKYLSAIFAIEVCAYAIMWNHYHAILRTRPDLMAGWTDREVAIRWLRLFPKRGKGADVGAPPTEEEICALADSPGRIAQLRKRLCSISWFMGQINEFIARAANKEDKVKGRFWESRFKCQVLLDEAAIAACMVYVDLNLIRAGLAATPEESDFTSIQERIRAWQKETMSGSSVDTESTKYVSSDSRHYDIAGNVALASSWLCPISNDAQRFGILQMTAVEYIDLVDRSGRTVRSGKRGSIDADLTPILLRLGANPDTWVETISHFESRFCLAAGLISNLRRFTQLIGSRWLKGFAIARTAFVSPLP